MSPSSRQRFAAPEPVAADLQSDTHRALAATAPLLERQRAAIEHATPEAATAAREVIGLRGRTIVCFASAFDYDPTSKHHVMTALSQHNRILWINYHATRRPTLSRGDLRACVARLRRVRDGVRPARPNIWQMTPLVIPGTRSRWVGGIHQRLLIAQIRRALRKIRGSGPVQVWTFAPDVAFVRGAFREEAFVYYCVDDYSKFEDMDGDTILRKERALLNVSDVVLVTSQELARNRREQRPDLHLVRHGVDHAHFAAALRETLPVPADLAALPRPVFGFFGLVHHWIDVGLIERTAALRPQYQFVIIGDCHVDVAALSRRPNVHLLGRRPYSTLPAYCRGFDAGLLPFVTNEMTRNVNPIKLREYLAAGLPVVSTPLPEARGFGSAVHFAEENAEAFAAACDRVVADKAAQQAIGESAQRRKAISDQVAHESWSAVTARVARIVVGAMPLTDGGARSQNEASPPHPSPKT